MTELIERLEPSAFSPGVAAADPLADYWLRQATVRLRREVTWLRHERGVPAEADPAVLPPFTDAAQSALDLRRHREAKAEFFRTDATARYLTEQLAEPPPGAAPASPAAVRGSFGWVLEELELDDLAAFVLALTLSASLDNAVGSVIAACLNDAARVRPDLALAQRLWDEPARVLSLADAGHPLFRHRLIRPAVRDAVLTGVDWDTPLRVPALVARQLLFPSDPEPDALVRLRPRSADRLPGETGRLVANRLAAGNGDRLRVVPVLGPKGSAHAEVVRALAAAAERPVARLAGELERIADAAGLDAVATYGWLRGLDLFVDGDAVGAEAGRGEETPRHRLPSSSIPATVYVGLSDRRQLRPTASAERLPTVEVPRLSYAERVAYWRETLGSLAEGLEAGIGEAARRFRFGKELIDAVVSSLRTVRRPLVAGDLITACRAELDLDLGDLAQRVEPRFRDESLILPPRQERQFEELVRAMRSLTEVHYGWGTARAWNESGITALFAGPPGTGKTMGAEILALELDLPMYRIDLSQVVDKYIGETEKNLKKLFDAADDSDVLLFFDEADSLFGRRTEVKDAHDRYANLEVSYLLERMERFKGLAILATNRRADLDEAFLRRLRYIIEFPLPGERER
ncbi:MAG: ATP-binding protein, partial [Gemmatimonadota bacterium]